MYRVLPPSLWDGGSMFTRTMGSVHMRFECDCAKLHNQRLVLIRVILFFFRCTWVDRDSSERVITPFSAPSSSCFFQVSGVSCWPLPQGDMTGETCNEGFRLIRRK
ncbi:hypothetical protein BRADI_1g04935v3 [Brachypodium distachyon]|uniref:Uncharacterized protein n=1 Tax=Brachypodium distachyon TaxID=15368 RepID=A0A2K2DI60_BRADI|nr:hypothetical protein BRADI_1g04935v3 [Brachypodium distachyon]